VGQPFEVLQHTNTIALQIETGQGSNSVKVINVCNPQAREIDPVRLQKVICRVRSWLHSFRGTLKEHPKA
jgi:hypothetical protein